jgi:diguanylate cyclase
MNTAIKEFRDSHWIDVMLQSIDVGIVILDRKYKVEVWNDFIENHSGLRSRDAKGKNIFDLFPEIEKEWFKHKAESVFMLESRAFSTWEQRPYVFRFKNYRPITGIEEFMYQNMTITPITSLNASIDHICIMIYDVTDIATQRKELTVANAKLESMSRIDQLTQLNNRGYWEGCLKQEFERYQRYKNKCSLAMFDIDHFKSINDTYGHHVGDDVLRSVANIIKETIRTTDVAGRYGGEEFAIILLNNDADNALQFSERLRKNIEANVISTGGHNISVTISIGIAEFGEEMHDHISMIKCADKAMYQSKESGRNRTMVYAA